VQTYPRSAPWKQNQDQKDPPHSYKKKKAGGTKKKDKPVGKKETRCNEKNVTKMTAGNGKKRGGETRHKRWEKQTLKKENQKVTERGARSERSQ